MIDFRRLIAETSWNSMIDWREKSGIPPVKRVRAFLEVRRCTDNLPANRHVNLPSYVFLFLAAVSNTFQEHILHVNQIPNPAEPDMYVPLV
jgi:hypothetical protein